MSKGRGSQRVAKARNSSKKAKQLSSLELACQATPSDLAALSQIIAGGPAARNAQSRVRALELKWAYGHGRPAQPLDHKGKVTLEALVTGSLDPSLPTDSDPSDDD